MPRPKSNRETEAFRRLIQYRLRHGTLGSAEQRAHNHLDEDALSAFVEGRLSERESAPLVQHLVACGFCRGITAQLIRLEAAIGASQEIPNSAAREEEEPGRFSRFLADLASRVLPSSEDDAVFAYHAPAEDFQQKDEAEETESAEGDRPEGLDKPGEQ